MFNKLRQLWSKTIFPDKIKAYKEEKAMKAKIQQEARKEALTQLKPELIKHYKQKELDRLTGKRSSDMLQKLADGFKTEGGAGLGSTESINRMLGIKNEDKKNGKNKS